MSANTTFGSGFTQVQHAVHCRVYTVFNYDDKTTTYEVDSGLSMLNILCRDITR